MPPRFPRRAPNGSFCIAVMLGVDTRSPDLLERRVAGWLATWSQRNRTWVWFGEEVEYSSEFDGSPFHVECTTQDLTFRMKGQPTAKWWRDILAVHLLEDLQVAFAEIVGVVKIEDCPETPPGDVG